MSRSRQTQTVPKFLIFSNYKTRPAFYLLHPKRNSRWIDEGPGPRFLSFTIWTPEEKCWPALASLPLPGGVSQAARTGTGVGAAGGAFSPSLPYGFLTRQGAEGTGGGERNHRPATSRGRSAGPVGGGGGGAASVWFVPAQLRGKKEKTGEAGLPGRGGLALRDRGPSPALLLCFSQPFGFPTSILGKEQEEVSKKRKGGERNGEGAHLEEGGKLGRCKPPGLRGRGERVAGRSPSFGPCPGA